MELAHDDQLYGGHLGNRKTQKKLQQYWWPNMTADIKNYVQSCPTCQRYREPKGPTPGKLHPIPISKIFQHLHIDIVGPINANAVSGARYIVTAIDAFTRFAFAKAFKETKTDQCLQFLEEIISIYGVPETVVSDQGAQFTSSKWRARLEALGVKHRTTTAYHPQTNGMDERLNGTLVKILKNYVNQHPNTWDDHLKWAIHVYNITQHNSTGYSPYEAMFGYKPRSPLNLHPSNALGIRESRELIRKEIHINDTLAKNKQKKFYDRVHPQTTFAIGQTVLMRQHVASQPTKFAYKWDGPAVVLKLPGGEEDPNHVILLDLKNSCIKSVGIQHIKPYILREEAPHGRIAETVAKIAANSAQKQQENDSTSRQLFCDSPAYDIDMSPYTQTNSTAQSVPTEHAIPVPQNDPVIINMDVSNPEERRPPVFTVQTRRKQPLPIISPAHYDEMPLVQAIDANQDWLHRRRVTFAPDNDQAKESDDHIEVPSETFTFRPESGSTPTTDLGIGTSSSTLSTMTEDNEDDSFVTSGDRTLTPGTGATQEIHDPTAQGGSNAQEQPVTVNGDVSSTQSSNRSAPAAEERPQTSTLTPRPQRSRRPPQRFGAIRIFTSDTTPKGKVECDDVGTTRRTRYYVPHNVTFGTATRCRVARHTRAPS